MMKSRLEKENGELRELLSAIWNDYADSHAWVSIDEACYSGFEDGKIREYALKLNDLGIAADPDAKLAALKEEYMEGAGNKEYGQSNMRP